jgi:hypothetical protein
MDFMLEFEAVTLHGPSEGISGFWQISGDSSHIESLYPYPWREEGKIRIMEFPGQSLPQIRSGAAIWDTGGILDVDLRVTDIQQAYLRLEQQCWNGLTPPVYYNMGGFVVWEVLMQGPDGIIIALVERVDPPLPQAPKQPWRGRAGARLGPIRFLEIMGDDLYC